MKKSSTKPKGATSYKETVFGIIPRQKLLKLELEGTKKGLNFIHDLITKNSSIEITSQLICKIHETAFGWIFPEWAGKYRIVQVTISGNETPSYYKLPELMVNLCSDLKERLKHLPNPKSANFIIEIVKLISWFQHQFVLIHPFFDYNGRTARILTILILIILGLPAVEIKIDDLSDRKNYLQAMQEADKGDISRLENILEEAITEALEQFPQNK